MNIPRIRIIVADDHSIFRIGLKNLLKQLPFVVKIDEASNGVEVLDLLTKADYDIIFMDIEMPLMNGLKTVREISLLGKPVKIIMLTMFCSENYIMDVYERNLSGYILKNTNLQELKRALENVLEGGQYFCPEANQILLKKLLSKEYISFQAQELSDREMEILLLICEQFTNSEISEKLCISDHTVKRHRQNLLEKTGAKTTAGLVLFALRNNLIRF
jgi:DNA-binding NarL/FixJ family response regulator